MIINHYISLTQHALYSKKYQGSTSKLVYFKSLEVHALLYYTLMYFNVLNVFLWYSFF